MPNPNVQVEAGTLTASVSERTVTGLLLPFGEVGRTNLGKFSVEPTAVAVPRDPSVVTLNTDHLRDAPVGRATALSVTDAGIVATFAIADTDEGDALLIEIDDKDNAEARRSLSAEVANVVIRTGRMVAGRLFGAAAVAKGAFPSAALVASDVGEEPQEPAESPAEPEGTETSPEPSEAASEAQDPTQPPAEPDNENTTTERDTEMPENNAAAPAGLPRPGASREGVQIETTGDLYAAVAHANSKRDGTMLAALNDITGSAHAPNMAQPQYVGELWEGVGYQRQYIPLFNHADLTSFKVSGWRWTTKPTVAAYAGDKADVHSNTPVTEPTTIDAERIAGAHDIDRRYRDFNDTSFFESYYKAMTESYAEVSDVSVLDTVVDALTPASLSGDAPVGTNDALAAIVQGYYQILRATRQKPNFALIADDLHEALLYVKEADRLAFLEKVLGTPVDSNFFQPSVDLPAGSVLVGAKAAVTVHELGGGTPIRVEAIDVAKGGIDAGVFGYLAVNIHNEAGLALIDTASAG